MMMEKFHYVLGLDLGIASVGWAAIEIDKETETSIGLLDCGVRTFERAEVPKTGDSLAKARREARSTRRLIRRRSHRLLRLKRLLKREIFRQPETFKDLPINAWQLRVKGLDSRLNEYEWAAVLLHLVKHRGYLSQRKSEMSETDSKSEMGRLLAGVAENHQLLQQEQYRTPAELALKKFVKHFRNKGGDYAHTFNRLDLQAELHLLFQKQRELGNPFTSPELERQVDDLLMTQRSALQGDAILKMLGHCGFEPEQFKAAKNTFSAERFIWLTKLNNLRIQDQGKERALTADERTKLLDEPYKKSKLTYAQVRKLLSLPQTAIFKGLRYDLEHDKKAENSTLMEMKSYHKIRQTLEKSGLKTEWQSIATQPEILDAIGTAFSIYKTDEDISHELKTCRLPENVLNELLKNINFDGFIQLSLTALRKILPLMEQGYRYDEACTQIYGNHHSGSLQQESKQLLPHIPIDDVRNPVVFRTLTQARKVVNAIIRRYGSPARVHIEMARELGKSKSERDRIEKQQQKNKKERENAVAKFKEDFPDFVGEPRGKDILKMRLYEQQHGKCLYSGHDIDIKRLNEKGYVEIDHALPFSRTWDDSQNNKVLVLGSENQNKRNQTPYEYLDGANNSQRWLEFQARVQTCHFSYGKKQRIQLAKLDDETEKGFLERNLNDTRYIARFMCQFVQDNLYLTGKGKRLVFASNGGMTATLRNLWGLRKVREDNDRHHALDAIVVACSTASMQQKITKAFQRHESLEYVDTETGEVKFRIPQPWDFFRQEVMIRVFSDQPCEDLVEKLSARPEALHDNVTPLFVSRAPNRKMSGQGHLETIKSAKRLSEENGMVKKPLTTLKLKDIPEIVGYPNREPQLYAALKTCLETHDDDPIKAFAKPFYKPNKNGELGALVRSVRVKGVQNTGVMVHDGKGIADNATMVRVDVYTKAGKNYLVPVYVWQVAQGILPNRAVTSGKSEADWDLIDESFEFKFSLSRGDLVEMISNKGRIFGYYNGLDRANGSIGIREHDLEKSKGKDGVHRVGVKTATAFNKYHVDPLGKEIHRCSSEPRPTLKIKSKK